MKLFSIYRFGALLTLMSVMSASAASSFLNSLPVKTLSGHEYYYYEVLPKETLFSLSHKLGISQEMIVAFNPAVADGLKAHTILYFPVHAFQEPAPANTSAITHLVKKQETIYGLAHQYGISEADLIAANPELKNGLKTGSTIVIPATGSAAVPDQQPSGRSQGTQSPEERVRRAMEGASAEREDDLAPSDQVVLEVEVERAPSIDIAIMLPFMLSSEKPGKQAKLYTEFYKGFLLAVDTLRKTDKLPVTLRVYDTAGSADSVNAILRKPELAGTSIIIAPESPRGLELIGDFAKRHNILVLNNFVPRDDSYLTNPSMLQAVTPTELMNDITVSGFLKEFEEYTPVFISHSGAKADKSQFVNMLKAALDSAGRRYETVSFANKLTASDMSKLAPSVNYVFVPMHGSQKELNLILPALVERKDATRYPVEMALFGYPEWTTFLGSTLQGMHQAGTTIFSRFYNDKEDPASQSVEAAFKHWFGNQMLAAAPRQGLLGYDTGIYLLRSLAMPLAFPAETPRYNGLQNGFNFVSLGEGKGFCNDVVYFVTFKPGGIVDRRIVK